MKTIAKKLLNKAGYDVLKLKNSNFTIDANLLNIIRKKNINCIIDVGANSGQYGAFLRRIGFKGHILSFEPVSHVFKKLQSAAKHDAKWQCFQYALGDRDEKKELNVYKSTVFSSFLEANEYSKNTWNALREVRTEIVQIKKLENIYHGLMKDIGNVTCMLKMDTQGYDVNVFEGARAVLGHIEALQSEIAAIKVYEHMPDGLDALKLFQQYGYYISGMFPINREESLAVIEFDCLLVKRDTIDVKFRK